MVLTLAQGSTLYDLLTSVTVGVGIDTTAPFQIKYLHIEFTPGASIKVFSGEFRFVQDGRRRQVSVTALGPKLSIRELEPYGFEHEFVPGRPLLEELRTMTFADMYRNLDSPDIMVARLVHLPECGLLIDGLKPLESNPSIQVSQGDQISIPCGGPK